MLTNKDLEPRQYKHTPVFYRPDRQTGKTHWRCYLNDKELKKIIFRELEGRPTNINAAWPLAKAEAESYALSKEQPTKKIDLKPDTKKKGLTIANILDEYLEFKETKLKEDVKEGRLSEKKFKNSLNTITSPTYSLLEYKPLYHATIEDVDYKMIEDYIKFRKAEYQKSNPGETMSGGTLRNHLQRLSAACNRKKIRLKPKEKRKKIFLNYIIDCVKSVNQDYDLKSKSRNGAINYFQYKNLIQYVKDNFELVYYDFFIYEFWSGARGESEVLDLEWDHVKDLKEVTIPAHMSKEKTDKTFPLFSDVQKCIERRYKVKNSKWVFSTEKGKQIARADYSKVWYDVRKKFDLRYTDGKYMTPHVMRNCFIQNASDASVYRREISVFTGHHSEQMTKYYDDIEKEGVRTLLMLEIWKEQQEIEYQKKLKKETSKKALKTFFDK